MKAEFQRAAYSALQNWRYLEWCADCKWNALEAEVDAELREEWERERSAEKS